MKQSKVQFEPVDGTLGELREIVSATQHLPAETEVRVQVRLGMNVDGTAIRRMTLVPQDRSGRA